MTCSFVYEWTDHYNGMVYIGMHTGSEDDGYVGSGKIFKRAYQRNPHYFTREVISRGTREEMVKLEKQLQIEVNASKNPRYYNLTNGRGKSYHSEATKQKISAMFIDGRRAGKNNSRYGAKVLAETKKKISAKNKQWWEENRQLGLERIKNRKYIQDPKSVVVMHEGVEYPSLNAAAVAVGRNRRFISHRANSDKYNKTYLVNKD